MITYLKKAKWELWASGFLSIADVLCVSYYPWLLSYVIDHFDQLDGGRLAAIIGTFLLSILGILAVSYGNKLSKANYEKKICRELRQDVFAGMARMDYARFHSQKTEVYTSFLMHDIDQLYTLYFENLIYLGNSILMLVVYTVILASLSWQMCLVIMGSLVLVFLVPRLVGRQFHRLNEDLSAGKADYLSRVGELLSAHDLMDGSNRDRLRGLHRGKLNGMQEKQYQLVKYRSFVQVFSGSALYVQQIACFAAGLALAHAGVISVGLFASSLLYVEYVAQYSCNIVDEFLEIRSAKTYRDKCMGFLSIPREPETGAAGAFESLTLENVSYEIGEKPILQGASGIFEKGKKYLITGANGAGKSTLMKILAGLAPVSQGKLLFNGSETYQHGAVGYIPQRRYVFEGTLGDNISLFAEEISPEQRQRMETLCQMVNLPYPLEHPVARNGENLSGGEIAKLCLIRELYRNRELLLIDEPMNDVDARSAKDILNFLLALPQTVIMVAHGLGEQERFDAVMTIGDGKLK